MALPAAKAAYAAQQQGKFWAYHDKIFAQYSQLTDEKFVAFATELGLDMTRFNKDRNSPQAVNHVNQDLRLAQAVGVRGTPTVFINGLLMENRSVQGASQMIDAELKRLSK